MSRFTEIVTKRWHLLTICLLSGISYFVIALKFINMYTNTAKAGMLLGFFFSPAIIFGVALLLMKQIQLWKEQENEKAIKFLIGWNVIMFIIAIVFAIDLILTLI